MTPVLPRLSMPEEALDGAKADQLQTFIVTAKQDAWQAASFSQGQFVIVITMDGRWRLRLLVGCWSVVDAGFAGLLEPC